MIEEHLIAVAAEVKRLKFDHDMAKVRGYDFVATLYRGQMEQLFVPIRSMFNELWNAIGAVRWHVDPRHFQW